MKLGSIASVLVVAVTLAAIADSRLAPDKQLLVVIEFEKYMADDPVISSQDGKPSLAERTIRELATPASGFKVTVAHSCNEAFTTANLKKYDAVLAFLRRDVHRSKKPELWATRPALTEENRKAILDFVRQGGGFVGVSGTIRCFGDANFPEFQQMIGTGSSNHKGYKGKSPRPTYTVLIVDNKHPSTAHLGQTTCEFAVENYFGPASPPQDNRHVLLRVPADDPGNEYKQIRDLAWTKAFGKGKIFMTGLGQSPSTWQDARFQKHLQEGIRHVLTLN